MTDRSRLLSAPARLFYDEGILGTGIDAVVREAGVSVSKPTLYAHFRSKDELVAVADPRDRPLAVFRWLEVWYAEDGARASTPGR